MPREVAPQNCLLQLQRQSALDQNSEQLTARYNDCTRFTIPVTVDHLNDERRNQLRCTGELLTETEQYIAEVLLVDFNLTTSLAHAIAAYCHFQMPLPMPGQSLGAIAIAKPKRFSFAAVINSDPDLIHFVVTESGAEITAVGVSLSELRPVELVQGHRNQFTPAKWAGPVWSPLTIEL